MLFGFFLFASCPKPTWSATDTYVGATVFWNTYFDNQEPIEIPKTAAQNQQNLSMSDTPNTPSFSWLPTHKDIWINNASSLIYKPPVEVQYANWNDDSISLLLHHDCPQSTPIHWQTTRHNGSTFATDFTTVRIPRLPYTQSIDAEWTCGSSTQSTTITPDNSLPIPHIQWQWVNANTLRIVSLDAFGSRLSLLHGNGTGERHIQDTVFVTHPLSVWDVDVQRIPDTHLRLELSNSNTVLYRSPSISVRNTAMSVTHTNDQTYAIEQVSTDPAHVVYTQLIGHNASKNPNPTPSLTQQSVSDGRLLKGLNWLGVQDISKQRQTVEPLWVYEGSWTWYKDVQWTSAHPSSSETEVLRASTPPYVRWGDALMVSTRYLEDAYLGEHTEWVIGNPLLRNLTTSPEDGLFYNHTTLSVLQKQRVHQITPPTTEPIPFLFRTDFQASDARLLTLLPLLKTDSFLSIATVLHHGSLFWDALHTRDLSWYNELLGTIHKALRHLELLPESQWNTLDFKAQLYIVWASLIADQEGLSPSAVLMRRSLTWLCGLSDTDIELDRALISHVRWLVTQSYWKHRSCTGSSQPLSTHPLTAQTVDNITIELQRALREQNTYMLKDDAPLWQQWVLYEQEKDLRDRYVNLHLNLENNNKTERGLFHEWQIRPIQALLTNNNATLQTSGVGRLYTSTWQPWIQSLEPLAGQTINVTRTLTYKNNTPLDPTRLEVGMPIQIHTTVQGIPSTPFCIRQWGSAGLAKQPQETHSCHTLNEQGHWSTVENTHVVYDGSYRLPATWVATQTDWAHTATVWLQTKRLVHP